MQNVVEPWQLALLALAWGAYFALHSVLASLWLKRLVAARHPGWMPGYRLAYNALAGLLLIPLLVWLWLGRGPWLWAWSGMAGWVADGLALAAVAGLMWTLRWYDGGAFLGLRQWRGRVQAVEDQERFHLSPLHRYVRHPWYSLGLVMLWTRDMDALMLTSAVMATLYLVVGSRLEERKLIAYHGERYLRYRERVPALIPWPGRFLGAEEARGLV